MAIKGKGLIRLLAPKEPDYIRIILEYAALQQKLDHVEDQSWYFKQGLAANRKKLSDLNARFEEIRRDFNEVSLDDLIAAKNKAAGNKRSILNRKGIGLILQVAHAATVSRIRYLDDLIELKSRVTEIKSIHYYFEHSEALFQLTGWKESTGIASQA